MPYDIFYCSAFQSELGALSKDVQVAVWKKISQIKEMPGHFDFLHKTDRIQKARVGKYRIFFRVSGNSIEFMHVRKRDIAYK